MTYILPDGHCIEDIPLWLELIILVVLALSIPFIVIMKIFTWTRKGLQ